ncbi:hypothetical protein JQS43_23120 [Natronosporangium hydrolyticum]|uniref:Uncharacterized protein n=1 Tax=Natronosporangium hydrolyticum TaxID=2811111 RepID=A0A895YG21_9ACTN|nr:hypothetical protein [Natronosporangium hydrolyticum]QSB14353.1 hypothetical protein JQS43_23120 [Natronosporangium hydrolyticum]
MSIPSAGPSEYHLPPQRPGTVTAAAVILFVSAGLGFLVCCALGVIAGEADVDLGGLLTLLLLFVLATAAFNVWLGYYILQGRNWARITTIVICSISIATGLIGFAMAPSDGILGGCIGLILNGVVIGLLSGREATIYFRPIRR